MRTYMEVNWLKAYLVLTTIVELSGYLFKSLKNKYFPSKPVDYNDVFYKQFVNNLVENKPSHRNARKTDKQLIKK